MKRVCLFALMAVLFACKPQKPPENPDAWKKIRLDLTQLDANGLAGPENGKVVVNYEFCIPAVEKNWRQVRKIDRSAKKNGGKGRIACKDSQWLVIGATNQKNHKWVLFQLASLPYVERIEPVYWE